MDGYKEMKPVTLAKRDRNEELEVNIYSNTLKNFLIVPKGVKVIGTIRRGMNMGLLAIDQEHRYVRVNGSYIEYLDEPTTRIVVSYLHSVARSCGYAKQSIKCSPPDFADYVRTFTTKPPPQVTVRKRRQIELIAKNKPSHKVDSPVSQISSPHQPVGSALLTCPLPAYQP